MIAIFLWINTALTISTTSKIDGSMAFAMAKLVKWHGYGTCQYQRNLYTCNTYKHLCTLGHMPKNMFSESGQYYLHKHKYCMSPIFAFSGKPSIRVKVYSTYNKLWYHGWYGQCGVVSSCGMGNCGS